MATTKAELLKEAKALGIEVDAKSKISEIRALIEAKNTDEPQTDEQAPPETEKATAKAGKRSTKALAEAAEKQAKEERKSEEQPEGKPKVHVPPARSRLERRGKHFRKSAEQIEAGKTYTLEQAAALAKKTSHVKFDATVELHVNLGVDPKHADQNIRDNVALPAGTGKKVRIAVLSDDPAAAKAAGADLCDNDALLAALEKGSIGFDILISTPAHMSKLGKYARILGPRGLMPNPKSGTVTSDITKAIKEAKAGRVEYRVDSTGIVHLGLGKVSFTEAQLTENLQAVLSSIKANKPQSVKGNYLNAVYVSTSMGPSIPIDISTIG
ncbi:MAG TPA: 50S ribosomal protein L1 [Candidatus Dormibacteraeota bacterium]|nr:50S ribosomal protein L1 [Candidatus Dormibacteraeota bacterium]